MNIFITSFILYELLRLWIRISTRWAETGKHHTDLTWLNSRHIEVHQVHQVMHTKFSITKLTNQFTGQRVGHFLGNMGILVLESIHVNPYEQIQVNSTCTLNSCTFQRFVTSPLTSRPPHAFHPPLTPIGSWPQKVVERDSRWSTKWDFRHYFSTSSTAADWISIHS